MDTKAPLSQIQKPEELKAEELSEQEIRLAAKKFFDKLKGRLPSADNRLPSSLTAGGQNDGSYYSIILKSCEDKEKLAHALKQVLTRSFLAIRMAIDNMPDILVYKGKVEGLAPIIKALRSQNAGFSIVPGNFNFKKSVTDIFSDFSSLFPEVQSLIKGMPINLWLGDKILGVFPEVCLEALGRDNKGVLVVTDQALYFVYKENYAELSSVVIPYSGIEQLFLEEGRGDDGLLVSYKDIRDEDMLLIADELILSEAYESSSQALKNQQSSIWIKAVCPTCGHSEQQAVDNVSAKEKCLYCEKSFLKTLVMQ